MSARHLHGAEAGSDYHLVLREVNRPPGALTSQRNAINYRTCPQYLLIRDLKSDINGEFRARLMEVWQTIIPDKPFAVNFYIPSKQQKTSTARLPASKLQCLTKKFPGTDQLAAPNPGGIVSPLLT